MRPKSALGPQEPQKLRHLLNPHTHTRRVPVLVLPTSPTHHTQLKPLSQTSRPPAPCPTPAFGRLPVTLTSYHGCSHTVGLYVTPMNKRNTWRLRLLKHANTSGLQTVPPRASGSSMLLQSTSRFQDSCAQKATFVAAPTRQTASTSHGLHLTSKRYKTSHASQMSTLDLGIEDDMMVKPLRSPSRHRQSVILQRHICALVCGCLNCTDELTFPGSP